MQIAFGHLPKLKMKIAKGKQFSMNSKPRNREGRGGEKAERIMTKTTLAGKEDFNICDLSL